MKKYRYLDIVDFGNPRHKYLENVSIRPLLWEDVHKKIARNGNKITAKTLKQASIDIAFYLRFELFR